MLRKNCVSRPTKAAHTNTSPTWLAMYGYRMNSPEARPTPAATTPGPMIRHVERGGSGRSFNSGAGTCRVGKASTTEEPDAYSLRADMTTPSSTHLDDRRPTQVMASVVPWEPH